MTGCFRPSSSRPTPGERSPGKTDLSQRMAVAHFEPSFDEPNLKASFDFSIVIPESYTALSNQPEKDNQSVGNGLKKVTFVTAPKMSTYVRLNTDCSSTRADPFSCTLGPAANSSTSKHLRTASTKAGASFPSGFTPPRGSVSWAALRSRPPGTSSTITRR